MYIESTVILFNNTSPMTTIITVNIIESLSTDILRRLAGESYRTWKLLCLASHTLAARLGFYHEYKGIYIVCDIVIGLPFEVFEKALVDGMSASERQHEDVPYDTLELATNVTLYCSDGDSDDGDNTIIGESAKGYILLAWDGRVLRVTHGDTIFTMVRADSPHDMHNTYVNGEPYRLSYPLYLNSNYIYTWIYNELPALFNVISIWKRVRSYDITRPMSVKCSNPHHY